MKRTFRGYYPPSKVELDALWTESIIVLDTSALLNLFRYSEKTRDELLELLRKEESRIWLPYQVALEFHRNRRKIPGQQVEAFQQVEKALETAKTGVRSAIESLSRHPALEANDLSELLEKHMSKISRGLLSAKERHLQAVVEEEAHSATFDSITDLYDGKVGPSYSDERLKEVHKEGNDRYARKVPPGFEDQDKDASRRFGDLILWKQMLDHGATEKRPMLFITDDGKLDWWEKVGNKTIGPRPELVEEYFDASGERIHFYAPRRFLAYAKERGANISDASVEEARKVSSAATIRALKLNARTQTRVGDRLAAHSRSVLNNERMQALFRELDRAQSPRAADIAEALARSNVNVIADKDQWNTLGTVAAENLRLAALHSALNEQARSRYLEPTTDWDAKLEMVRKILETAEDVPSGEDEPVDDGDDADTDD